MNCNAIVYKEGSEKMHTGDRMKRIRLAFDMTQSELGVRLGFDEKSAAIRVSQYESGYRVPKKDIIQEFCDIFKCQPMMVEGHGITLIDDFMINLLWLEDEKGIDILSLKKLEMANPVDHGELTYGKDSDYINGTMHWPIALIFKNIDPIERYMEDWCKVRTALLDGKITEDEYFRWKINWPTPLYVQSIKLD